MKHRGINRRAFIQAAGITAGAFTIVPRSVLGGNGFTPPSDQLTKAVIGVGAMGRFHFDYEGRLVAICDVDQNHLSEAESLSGANIKTYTDYRELLEQSDIDVVHIATPPHWHGIMAADAARAGKDVWCEKPMTRTIGEGIALRNVIAQQGRMFRLNTWFRFVDTFYGLGSTIHPVKKLVENRVFGWPLKITLNKSTGFDWKFFWSGRTDLDARSVPDHLNYDMWLGPAPYKPYHPDRVHVKFRGYWDYDGGGLGDMGQHYLDPAQYLLEKDETSPTTVLVDAPQQHPDAAGSWRRIEYTYADGCKIVLDGENRDRDASFIEGPSGKLYPNLRSDIAGIHQLIAELPDPTLQLRSFSRSVRTREKFTLNEVNGHRSCTLINLGVTALRLGQNLTYDPLQERFVDNEAANRMINQSMRGAWRI
ncbi:MAG: Gfo/Idh/MocA family oxidoreductase [Saprospiraceae bacterium]|nr:Gfo/Idh/MocA family oxidoreductase [Saprospiraceae bacterium]